jgi:TRAF3-interacting protein 1
MARHTQATQAALERLIQRPKLSDKLLSKPPFRFLHDIITEVEKATGFSAGLYGPDLSDSAQVKDKAAKVRNCTQRSLTLCSAITA